MKNIFLIFCILILAGGSTYASHSLNITDYDTTVSGAQQTSLNMTYMNDSTMNPYGKVTLQTIMGQYGIAHRNFYDSYNKAWSYRLSLSQIKFSMPIGKINMRDYIAQASYSSYFMPEQNIFFGGSGYWREQGVDDGKSPVIDGWNANVSAMIGMGHIVDITPIAEAGVLEDRLKEAGLIKGNIPKKDMLKLAEIIRKWRMNEYALQDPDTAKGYFMADISKVLEGSGVLTRPLEGFGFWRISESRNVNYLRTKGERFTLSIAAEHISGYNHFLPGDIVSSNDQNNYFQFDYEKYMPLDWVSQLSFLFTNKIALNPEDVYPVNAFYMSLAYTYDLTNNIWFDAAYEYNRNNFSLNDVERSNMNSARNLSAGINYKIEDFSITSLSFNHNIGDDWDSTEYIELTQGFYW